MIICQSDFIPLLLLSTKYTDRQIAENSIYYHYQSLLKQKSHHMHITKAGSYTRGLRGRQDKDSFTQKTLLIPRVRIRRGMSCKTHSFLSDLCLPHSVFTLTFVMTVIYLHFVKHCSLSYLEQHWHISIKTIKRWKKLYITQAKEWKLALQELKKECDDLASLEKSIPPFPYSFYCFFNTPFLSSCHTHLILSDDPFHPPDHAP